MVPNVVVAFITGLTAGGIGCVVVQSGLLAGTLARHFERDDRAVTNGARAGPDASTRPRFALTISLFLCAKLIAYTLLGFLLGAFGSLLQLTPTARAVLMIVIGVFIAGNGLRMLGVHPVFRWFVLEPPSGVRRFIRRASHNGASPGTPIFLGALTVFLPCGVSQAIMATALGTGDPFQGAALLFAFTLGTIPIFFFAAYCATRLGAALDTHCTRAVALVLIVLGGVSVFHGLNLAGVPVTLPQAVERLVERPSASLVVTSPDAGADSARGHIISVSGNGYEPNILHLPAGEPVTLIWVSRGDPCCAQSLVVPGLNYRTLLPAAGRVPLAIPPQESGTVLSFSCSTGRFTGRLVFDRKGTATTSQTGR